MALPFRCDRLALSSICSLLDLSCDGARVAPAQFLSDEGGCVAFLLWCTFVDLVLLFSISASTVARGPSLARTDSCLDCERGTFERYFCWD